MIVFVSKLILHFSEFLNTLGTSWISFSVNVLNFHLSATSKSSSIFSKSFSISFPKEKILYFPFSITTISLSSRDVNSSATLLNAFISLEINVHLSQTQTIIGLQSLAQISIHGFWISITAIA